MRAPAACCERYVRARGFGAAVLMYNSCASAAWSGYGGSLGLEVLCSWGRLS